jgi:hypothetical protein
MPPRGCSLPAATFRPTTPLAQGPHFFAVTAANQHSLTSSATPGHFFVDSLPPVGQLTLTGAERQGTLLHLRISDSDLHPGVPAADASGVASVLLDWGDGTTGPITAQTATHRYLRAGHYRVTITITDRAGNRTVLTRALRITAAKTKHK